MIIDLMEDVDISNTGKTLLNGRFIYFVSNSDDEIVYIGQTTSLAYRVHDHKSKEEYKYLRAIPVDAYVELNDAEFFYINKYKPKYNKALPTPSFLTTKSRIISDELECMYDMDKPDISTVINGNIKRFWLKVTYINHEYAKNLVIKINKQNDFINKYIDELPVGRGCRTYSGKDGVAGDYTLTKTANTEFYNKQSDDWNDKLEVK